MTNLRQTLNRATRALALVGLCLALTVAPAFAFTWTSQTSGTTLAAPRAIPVEALLNPDGTLNTSTGASGTLDLRGWNVTLDSVRGPVLSRNAPAALAAGTWSALGTGLNDDVYAIAISGSDVYAGGVFTTAGGNAANYIAKWNGAAWSALGTGLDNPVYAIAISGSDVYAGGYFTTAGGNAANSIAKWDGTAWSALGTGLDSSD